VHVGLADDASYQRIEVQWPGGQREVFPGGKANQIVILTEGTGSPDAAAKPGPGSRR
jgi:ASPIC and UnbV